MKNYNHLNLDQKIIKIRKKIPLLIRKRYSEEVDYDFVKIDDIYEFLTPALNKYGVNFDIVNERATLQETGKEHAQFLVEEENGLWRYEADLQVSWTNADHPDEMRMATFHLIGTHEMPEKAKGTAWTYGLKYYLLNKFNIQQGYFEDSDMSDKVEEEIQKPETSKSQMKTEPKKQVTVSKPSSKTVSPAETGKSTMKNRKEEDEKAEGEKDISEKAKIIPAAKESGKEEQTQSPTAKETVSEAEGTEDITEKIDDVPKTKETKAVEKSEEIKVDKVAEEAADGFHALSATEEVPFEENVDFMAELQNDTSENQDTSIEAARNFVCNFGLYAGKTLGEMLDSGPKGLAAVKWIAENYKGANTDMKDAACSLLKTKDENLKQVA